MIPVAVHLCSEDTILLNYLSKSESSVAAAKAYKGRRIATAEGKSNQHEAQGKVNSENRTFYYICIQQLPETKYYWITFSQLGVCVKF